MKLFYDCEFLEYGPAYPIEPISIGIVAEDGRELYHEYDQPGWTRYEDWVATWPQWHRQNIVPRLVHYNHRCLDMRCPLRPREWVKTEIMAFVGDDKPEWIGYYSSYDHVVLCQTFGRMIDLPRGWPMYTRDLKQMADDILAPGERLPKMEAGEHNALRDARWNKHAYAYLQQRRYEMLSQTHDPVLLAAIAERMKAGTA